MPSERRYIEISESPIAKCHQWAIIRRKEFHKIQNKLISKLRKTLLVHDVADMSWCIQRQAAPINRQYCTYTISVICLCLQGKNQYLPQIMVYQLPSIKEINYPLDLPQIFTYGLKAIKYSYCLVRKFFSYVCIKIRKFSYIHIRSSPFQGDQYSLNQTAPIQPS